MQRNDPNLVMLELAARALGPLTKEVVFLGGCATGLLITDAGAPPVRATRDVDVIVEIASLQEYHALSKKLRALGFHEDQSDGAPVCRWIYRSLVIDLMPTSPILGFANRWYPDALRTAGSIQLSNGVSIRMVSAPFFLATKLEAFHGRGRGDFMASHDLEDMIAVIDGRPTIVEEVAACKEVRPYLAREFSNLLKSGEFLDALPGQLPGDEASQERVPLIRNRMKEIAALENQA